MMKTPKSAIATGIESREDVGEPTLRRQDPAAVGVLAFDPPANFLIWAALHSSGTSAVAVFAHDPLPDHARSLCLYNSRSFVCHRSHMLSAAAN
jgi:hypothetical protein